MSRPYGEYFRRAYAILFCLLRADFARRTLQTIIAFLHKKDRTGSHPYGRPVLFKPTPEMTSAFSISD